MQANWGGTIEGNWIGPSATGAEITRADQDNGVTVELGTATVEDNVIAGHSTYGIDVLDTNTGLDDLATTSSAWRPTASTSGPRTPGSSCATG